jgi:hypothetical protein
MEKYYEAILQIHGLEGGILPLVVEINKEEMDEEDLGREAMTVSARPHPILLSYWFSTSHCTL